MAIRLAKILHVIVYKYSAGVRSSQDKIKNQKNGSCFHRETEQVAQIEKINLKTKN
jgi:hypothetical protein